MLGHSARRHTPYLWIVFILSLVLAPMSVAANPLPQASAKVQIHEQYELPGAQMGTLGVTAYASFDNPNYYYAAVKVPPSGTYYRSVGLSPDGTKLIAQKSWTEGSISRTEIVLMDADGTDEIVISPGNSGEGDIQGYHVPFWSDDGTAIGFVEVHVANPNKVIRYTVADGTRAYIYEPVAPLDVSNPDFLGTSKDAIVFWDYAPGTTAADLFIWDGSSLTNITNTPDYKEYEPVSNGDGTKILYWSGETTTEPINTTHTLTWSGSAWVKDQGFKPIPDSYWPFWSGRSDGYIGLTVWSTKDVMIYDSNGNFVMDLTGPGYSGGAGQWNFFGFAGEGPDGEIVMTSNAGRVDPGRNIVFAAPRSSLFVDDSGSDANPGTRAAPFATVQKGVNEASSGGTVHVAAGTYVEQAVIDKDVTLLGSGSDAVIQAPDVVPTCFTTSAAQHPIVCVKDGATATIDGFTVDGAGKGNANYRFVGVAFHNAGGTIQHTTIKDIRDTPFSGAQHGVAIYAYNEDGVNRTINVWDNVLTGFQKNGMALNASDTTPLTVDVRRNQVTGYGATPITAQNGIQIWADLGTGVVADNTIIGIAYDNTNSATKWVASSILNYYADLQITGNTVSQGHVGVYNLDGASQINGNDLTIEKVGISAYGIIATDPLDAVPSPYGEESSLSEVQLQSLNKLQATLNVEVLNNKVQFSGTDKTATYGIEADAGYGANDLNFTANGNDISGFEAGIEIYQCSGSCDPGVFTAVTANHNRLTGNTFGIRSNVSSLITNGEYNWWGSPCGPSGEGPGNGDAVSEYVDFSPWWADPNGTSTATEGPSGEIVIPAGATTAQAQAILDCAAGKTVMFESGAYPGGLTVNGNGTTVKLNGCTVGPGSPAFTIVGDDVTILGPGILDGGGNNIDPAVLVQPGADNFTIDGVEIKGWAIGIRIAGNVISLKVVNNWIHDNIDAGLQIDGAVGGVVTIEGNLFKANGGPGVRSLNVIDAEYNSWGDLGGPNVGNGDGADPATIDFDPWTFAEVFVDVDPDSEATQRTVTEVQTFDVKLKADAAKLYGLAFKLTYDPNVLTLNSLTFAAPWAGRCQTLGTPPAGTLAYRCDLQLPTPEYDADGGTIATLTFTPISTALIGNGPWPTLFDIDHIEANTSASAVGGVKVFVNNAGYGAPSTVARDITDANDGQIDIVGIAKFTGFVDLQGRTNDSGATVQVFGGATIAGATTLAQGTSAASGAYTTNYIPPHLLTIGTTYYFQVDAPLYLPTTARATSPSYPTLPTDWQHSKLLDTRPTTTLQNVLLLGGDATNDNVIDIGDAACIGNYYMQPAHVCTTSDTSADVNGDGMVTMRDLTLMGGNYYRTASPWTP